MRLYVANLTLHEQVVNYRLDFVEGDQRRRGNMAPQPKKQKIPKGRQVNIGGDLQLSQITEIVNQLNRFGMVGVVDIPRLQRGTFVPYLFNIDKPVTVAQMRQVMDHNKGIKIADGRQRRERAALAANEALMTSIGKEEAPPFEVEFEQLEASENDEALIEEGFRVSHETPPGKQPAKGGKGKNRPAPIA